LGELVEKIDARENEIWESAHKPILERNPNLKVETKNLANKISETLWKTEPDGTRIPTVATRNAPTEAKLAQKWLDSVSKIENAPGLDELIREINADLKNVKRLEGFGPLGIRVRQQFVSASRAELDRALATAGESGVLEWNRIYGSLRNIKEELQLAAVREFNREGRKGPIPNWIHLYSFLHPGASAIPVSIGMGLHFAKILTKTPGSQIVKGMEVLGRSNLSGKPYPQAPNAAVPIGKTNIQPTKAPTIGFDPRFDRAANMQVADLLEQFPDWTKRRAIQEYLQDQIKNGARFTPDILRDYGIKRSLTKKQR
jgi:hypothetical protein